MNRHIDLYAVYSAIAQLTCEAFKIVKRYAPIRPTLDSTSVKNPIIQVRPKSTVMEKLPRSQALNYGK